MSTKMRGLLVEIGDHGTDARSPRGDGQSFCADLSNFLQLPVERCPVGPEGLPRAPLGPVRLPRCSDLCIYEKLDLGCFRGVRYEIFGTCPVAGASMSPIDAAPGPVWPGRRGCAGGVPPARRGSCRPPRRPAGRGSPRRRPAPSCRPLSVYWSSGPILTAVSPPAGHPAGSIGRAVRSGSPVGRSGSSAGQRSAVGCRGSRSGRRGAGRAGRRGGRGAGAR